MAQASTTLGVLGNVDHFANLKTTISVGMIGRQYRVVLATVTNGALHERPFDDRLFDSIYEARAAAKVARELAA